MTKRCEHLDDCGRVLNARQKIERLLPSDPASDATSPALANRLALAALMLNEAEQKVENIPPCPNCPRATGI